MVRWSEQQYQEFMVKKQTKEFAKTADLNPDPGPEADLVGKCLKHCKDHGFIMQAFRQSVKAKGFLIPGWPDACLICRDQRVAWIEFKSSTGRFDPLQKEIRLKFSFMGHPVHKIKSFKSFLILLSTLELP